MYEEQPVAILDCQVRRLPNKDVASVKMLWQNDNREEMTWETEEEMKKKYPYLVIFNNECVSYEPTIKRNSPEVFTDPIRLI